MVVKLLVHSGKHGAQYWLVDTLARLRGAMVALFIQLDECGYYEDENETHLKQARQGNIRAIKGILESRRCCEYEYWDIEIAEIVEG